MVEASREAWITGIGIVSCLGEGADAHWQGLSEGRVNVDAEKFALKALRGDFAQVERNGDPKKAAQAIVQLSQEQKPPLRLLLGSDAYNGAEKNDLERLEEARRWKELSLSTDFETR